MRKMLFKKILSILDVIELQGVSLHDAPLRVYEEIVGEYHAMKFNEIRGLIGSLNEKKMLKTTPRGIDLAPAAAVYAKSNQNSGMEALSIFESFIRDPSIFKYYHERIQTSPFRDKQFIPEYIDGKGLQLMLQTTLFEVVGKKLCFHPWLPKGMSDILQEYSDEKVPLVSIVLTVLYISIIVAHEDIRIDYKNASYSMIDHKHKNIVHGTVPREGVPHNWDEVKALQVFYEDTLFHGFDHSCPVCGINIPYMLIASHIKPSHDYAHIYEAIDHDNGLLLCRNHDCLFDQGYSTFDENGYIIFSEELLKKNNLDSAYSLRKNYRPAEYHLGENRVKFMAYYREFIFHRNR